MPHFGPQAKPVHGILILLPDTGLCFANADRIIAEARRQVTGAGEDVLAVILSLEESPDPDSSSVEAIGDFCAAVLAAQKPVLFAQLNCPVL